MPQKQVHSCRYPGPEYLLAKKVLHSFIHSFRCVFQAPTTPQLLFPAQGCRKELDRWIPALAVLKFSRRRQVRNKEMNKTVLNSNKFLRKIRSDETRGVAGRVSEFGWSGQTHL